MAVTLAAETGRPTGTGASRRLRGEGKVPGVLYGHGLEPVALTVDQRDLRHALHDGVHTILDLTVAGRTHLAVVKELQRHPVRRTVTHVDFVVVTAAEAREVEKQAAEERAAAEAAAVAEAERFARDAEAAAVAEAREAEAAASGAGAEAA